MKAVRKWKDEAAAKMFGEVASSSRPKKAVFYFTVKTGAMKYAGTDSNVFVGLTGASGEKSALVSLDRAFRDDFERGKTDKFRVHMDDVGRPAVLTIKHEEAGVFSDWFVEFVWVQKDGENRVHRFLINMWVTGTMQFVEETKLPKKEENPILVSFHKREVENRKVSVKWKFNENFPAQGFTGCVMAESMGEVPRNLRLEDYMIGDFEGKKKRGKFSVFEKVFGPIGSLESVSDIKGLFLHPKLPQVPEFQQNWERDEEFGRQILNGCNPTILKRCDRMPQKFPVKHEMIASQLTRGVRLDEEIRRGNVYLIDFDIFDGISCGKNPLDGSPYFSCSPMCLLYVNNKKQLVPVAIQLGQSPGNNCPIWTPDDSECDWLLAKIYFRNAEINYQLIVEKIFRTHFVLEPFVIAASRCFSSRHPVLRLLYPHLRYVCGGNMLIRSSLLNPGGVLDRILSFGSGEHFRVIRSAFKRFDLSHLNAREILHHNGTMDAGRLPGYHFRDDALILWDAMLRFVSRIFSFFYKSDQEVADDDELQSFVREVRVEGFSCDEQHDRGIPRRLTTREQLVELVTSVIFTATCRHAAVTNGLYDVLVNVANAPLCMLLPPPQDKKKTTHDTILRSMPNKEISCMQVETLCCMVMSDAAKLPDDPSKVSLQDYPNYFFTEEAINEMMTGFSQELDQIGSSFHGRNQAASIPYSYLIPESIAFAATL